MSSETAEEIDLPTTLSDMMTATMPITYQIIFKSDLFGLDRLIWRKENHTYVTNTISQKFCEKNLDVVRCW